MKAVLGNLSDDIIADAAGSGTLVQAAPGTVWTEFEAARKEAGLALDAPGVTTKLASLWLQPFQNEVKKAQKPPPAESR